MSVCAALIPASALLLLFLFLKELPQYTTPS